MSQEATPTISTRELVLRAAGHANPYVIDPVANEDLEKRADDGLGEGDRRRSGS